eukprot:4602973-Pleurochrysis_carterae.AAC.1
MHGRYAQLCSRRCGYLPWATTAGSCHSLSSSHKAVFQIPSHVACLQVQLSSAEADAASSTETALARQKGFEEAKSALKRAEEHGRRLQEREAASLSLFLLLSLSRSRALSLALSLARSLSRSLARPLALALARLLARMLALSLSRSLALALALAL